MWVIGSTGIKERLHDVSGDFFSCCDDIERVACYQRGWQGEGKLVERVADRVSFLAVGQLGGFGSSGRVDGVTRAFTHSPAHSRVAVTSARGRGVVCARFSRPFVL